MVRLAVTILLVQVLSVALVHAPPAALAHAPSGALTHVPPEVPTLALCAEGATAVETARGTVFSDLDGDGRHGAGEPGVAAVSVSNGCEVVRTDSSGRFEIGISAGQILFVSQPEGWGVPVNEHQQPQFYYLHYPDGSPAAAGGETIPWAWEVVEPTGPLPASIDFPLHPRSAANGSFRAHAFADTQARTDVAEDMLREELVNALLGNPFSVAFSITVGDVVYDNLGLYPRHIEIMGLIGVPAWYLPGNHDVNFASPDAQLANETYKRNFGPTYYSFSQGSVHFVALNNVEYAGRPGNPNFGNGRYRGYISDDQLHWLERDLAHVAKDRLVVIATHIPLLTGAPEADGTRGGDNINTVNFDRLVQLLQPFEHVYAIAGHDTSNSWKQQIDHTHGWHGKPWIAHTLAEVWGNGWNTGPRDTRGVRDAMMQDGNPNGFYVLHFDGTSVVPEFLPFPTGPDADRRLRITLDPLPRGGDGAIHRGALEPGTKVVVNLFDGGERDRVWLSLDGSTEMAMTHVLRTDPGFERIHARYEGTDDAVGAPAVSSHVWELQLPADLGPGAHTLEVRTLDEFGQQRQGRAAFEVTH